MLLQLLHVLHLRMHINDNPSLLLIIYFSFFFFDYFRLSDWLTSHTCHIRLHSCRYLHAINMHLQQHSFNSTSMGVMTLMMTTMAAYQWGGARRRRTKDHSITISLIIYILSANSCKSFVVFSSMTWIYVLYVRACCMPHAACRIFVFCALFL